MLLLHGLCEVDKSPEIKKTLQLNSYQNSTAVVHDPKVFQVIKKISLNSQ